MTPDTLVVHCSWTNAYADIGAAEMRRWHVEGNGWADIGYHFVIRRDGVVETGRPISRPGAHVKGHNNHSIGVCLVGGKSAQGGDEDNFTEAQRTSLKALVALRPDLQVVGHRDLNPGKTCPVLSLDFLSK